MSYCYLQLSSGYASQLATKPGNREGSDRKSICQLQSCLPNYVFLVNLVKFLFLFYLFIFMYFYCYHFW